MVGQAWDNNYRYCHSKREKTKGKKELLVSSNYRIQPDILLLVSRPESNPLWPSAPSNGPVAHPFFLKDSTCLQLSNSSTSFLPLEFWEYNSLLSFHPLSVPFHPSWQYLYANIAFSKSWWVSCMCLRNSLHQTRGFSTNLSWINPSPFLASEMAKGIHESQT